MGYERDEKRTEKRSFVEPYDTGTFLEFRLEGKEYRFNLLDTSPDGMGMLVENGEMDVLNKLKPGNQTEMKYSSDRVSVFMNFEIRHITPIKRGIFKGHYQIGLSLLKNHR